MKHLNLIFKILVCTLVAIPLAACGMDATGTPVVVENLQDTPTATALPVPVNNATPVPGGLLLLSMTEGGTAHLFAFSPISLTLTRLTADPWDDIAPALSPDGSQIAYASRRNGYWDLYILDLSTGQSTRLTDTPQYESAPSWSPDGQWLVYESDLGGNLDLYVHSASDPNQAPIQLTNDSASDHSPAWSPGGRQVAFVSDRLGQEDIWLADLDIAGDGRYTNLSNTPQAVEAHPAWSADGTMIAWAATESDGLNSIYILGTGNDSTPARWAGTGSWPVWQDAGHLMVVTTAPNQWLLSGFSFPDSKLTLALTPLSGTVRGATWLAGGLPSPMATSFAEAAAQEPAPLYSNTGLEQTDNPAGRVSPETLEDVQAPYPQLHSAAVEPFQALRQRVAVEVGWDALASLGNAYVPLTTPLDPGLEEDWLYTGRAFALNPLLANAGWIAAVREDHNGQTFWRLYLRTLAQDGSQGAPLQRAPWNFNARYAGDPVLYDQGGGTLEDIPSGYWFDMTALALEYGWQRLPALSNWRTYLSGARFSEFVFPQGLDWYNAMLELYPPEALVTPTVVIPPTRTPTATPWFYRSPTPSLTSTPRPTLTPKP